jgi:DNA-binding NtrC family response regulator
MGQPIGGSVALVLIVDDDESLAEVTAETIRCLGHFVMTARSADEALDLVRTISHVGVLFTDIRLPGTDGELLAEAALALRPELRVILTSGVCRPSGRLPFVPKPYSTADLIEALPPPMF